VLLGVEVAEEREEDEHVGDLEDLAGEPVGGEEEAVDGVDEVREELGHLEHGEVLAPPEELLAALRGLDEHRQQVVTEQEQERRVE